MSPSGSAESTAREAKVRQDNTDFQAPDNPVSADCAAAQVIP